MIGKNNQSSKVSFFNKSFHLHGAFTFPLVIAAIGILAASWTGMHFRKQNLLIASDFSQKRFELTIHEINDNIHISVDMLTALNSMFLSSEQVDRTEFDTFAKKLIERHSFIEALIWAPKVTNEERQSFVQFVRDEGYENYAIKEAMNGIPIGISTEKPYYFPVLYQEPTTPHNENMLGVNFLSREHLSLAVHSAIENGTPTISELIKMPTQEKISPGILIFHAVPVNIADATSPVAGVTALAVNIDKLFEEVFAHLHADTVISIHDITENGKADPVYTATHQSVETYDAFKSTFKVDFLNRSWEVSLTPTKQSIDEIKSIEPWLIFFLGSGFAIFSAISIARHSKQREIVEKLVLSRTTELKTANLELEEFAYRSSHDLRSPLISSIRLIEIAKSSMHSGDLDTADVSLSHVEQSLTKLENLVRDILSLTKTKHQAEENRLIDVEKLIKRSIEQVAHLENFERVDFQIELTHTAELRTKESRFNLIAENLISNAIKYQDTNNKSSFIKILTSNNDTMFKLEVIDNGIGIPEHKKSQLFQMFQRFHGNVSFGSGLGLYMIEKSAALMGGTIEYCDTHNNTCFKLKIPLK